MFCQAEKSTFICVGNILQDETKFQLVTIYNVELLRKKLNTLIISVHAVNVAINFQPIPGDYIYIYIYMFIYACTYFKILTHYSHYLTSAMCQYTCHRIYADKMATLIVYPLGLNSHGKFHS